MSSEEIAIVQKGQLAKKDQVSKNLLKSRDRKIALISRTEVADGLSELELKIAKAGSKTPIQSIPEDIFDKAISVEVKFICRAIGIQRWNDAESISFWKKGFKELVLGFYGDMTLSEIKLAFDMSLTEKLDSFLPSDNRGVDKNHYQSFDKGYISKILNAYQAYKNKVWVKADGLALVEKTEPSKKEQNDIRKKTIQMIKDQFEIYKDTGVRPIFPLSFLIVKVLKDAGIIQGIPEPTEEDIKKALHYKMTSSVLSTAQRISMNEDVPEVMSRSRIESNISAVMRVFDEIINKGMSIDDIL